MRWRSLAMLALLATVGIQSGATRLWAADLRIGFAELSAIARQALGEVKLRLHNVPQGVLDFSAGSNVSFAGQTVAIPLPARSFDVAGGNYAYYLNDISTTAVRIEPVEGALRLTLEFEDADPELIGRCRSGLCPPANALPRIEWSQGSVAVDLAPIGRDESLSLEAKRVKVGGTFQATCRPGADILSGGICKAVLKKAQLAIVKLRGDLDELLRAQINKPELQDKIAAQLKTRLVLGPAGELKVRAVAVDPAAVTVTFCLACAS